MTLSRKIPLLESMMGVSAPLAPFQSGRRAAGVVGLSRTVRCRSIHGALAPTLTVHQNGVGPHIERH